MLGSRKAFRRTTCRQPASCCSNVRPLLPDARPLSDQSCPPGRGRAGLTNGSRRLILFPHTPPPVANTNGRRAHFRRNRPASWHMTDLTQPLSCPPSGVLLVGGVPDELLVAEMALAGPGGVVTACSG